jgi:hypothetical protein
MMPRHVTIRNRLELVEQALEPAPEEPGLGPEFVAFMEQMTMAGRCAFRQLLERNIELEAPEHEFDGTPLGQCVALTQQYVDAGLPEPEAFSRAAVETRIACGIPEW